MTPEVSVGIIDVGSPRSGKLGWALLSRNGAARQGGDLDEFIELAADEGRSGALAIGFEAPLFIPARTVAMDILAGRSGEGARPWSAGAGATVTTIGLAVMVYTLSALRLRLPANIATLGFEATPSPGEVLFLEAFVSGNAKGDNHAHDALLAAEEARRLLTGGAVYRSAIADTAVLSLLGACLLRTGWTDDVAVLSAPCLVVKPGFDHMGTG